jgi:hypothetical protein
VVGVFLCALTVLVIGLWHIGTVSQSLQNIGLARGRDCTFCTGDVILFQHERYQHGLDYLVSHMGSILVDQDEGALLVDINPTRNGAFDSHAIKPVLQFEALQLVRMEDVTRHYPGRIFVRPLLKPLSKVQESAFKQELLLWGSRLSYMEDIKKRSVFTWTSLAISTLIPELSVLIAGGLTKLASTRTSSFCTEILATAYERCGLLPLDKVWAYSRGPISWLYGMDPRTTLVWGREVLLV